MRHVAATVALLAVVAGGCQPSNPVPAAPPKTGAAPGPAPIRSGRPLAYVAGEAVTLGDLGPSLLEAAGGTVIAERVLGRLLVQRLESRGLTVTDDDLAAEEAIVRRGLSDDEDTAARLLADLRQGRGLGPTRFAALLRRNAGLRKLVAGQVTVSEPAVRQAYRLQHGPAARVRLIVARSLLDARNLRRRLDAGEPFGELAALESTDASAAQGGLLSPIRPDDLSYPQAIRTAAATLEPGQVSEPIALDGGFALLKLDERLSGDGVPYDAVKARLSEQVRRRAERVLMQQQASGVDRRGRRDPARPHPQRRVGGAARGAARALRKRRGSAAPSGCIAHRATAAAKPHPPQLHTAGATPEQEQGYDLATKRHGSAAPSLLATRRATAAARPPWERTSRT